MLLWLVCCVMCGVVAGVRFVLFCVCYVSLRVVLCVVCFSLVMLCCVCLWFVLMCVVCCLVFVVRFY